MDVADQAQNHREAEEMTALRRARLDVGISAYQCHDCFEVIPEKRRTALPGVTLCVACQESREREKR